MQRNRVAKHVSFSEMVKSERSGNAGGVEYELASSGTVHAFSPSASKARCGRAVRSGKRVRRPPEGICRWCAKSLGSVRRARIPAQKRKPPTKVPTPSEENGSRLPAADQPTDGMVTFTMKVRGELGADLERMADLAGVSKPKIVRIALERFLPDALQQIEPAAREKKKLLEKYPILKEF